MKYILILLTAALLVGCHHADVADHSVEAPVITPELLHPVTIASEQIDTALSKPAVQTETGESYQRIVTKYTENMNEVISTMSDNIDKQQAVKSYARIKANIKQYEQSKEIVKSNNPTVNSEEISEDIKKVDKNITHANEQYLASLDDIVEGIETKDDTLKQSGFNQFTQTHQLLNAITYEIAAPVEISEIPATEAPTTETTVVTEVYTAEAPVTETP